MMKVFAVALGGAIGSVLRYLIGLIKISNPESFPINTLGINVLGSFLIGLIVFTLGKENANPNLILFLKVGICGGFTTFSTFALEAENLITSGRAGLAFLYMILSFVLSISVIFVTGALLKA